MAGRQQKRIVQKAFSAESNCEPPFEEQQQAQYHPFIKPAISVIVVGIIVSWVHWPALSARALSFDDQQYLTENVLVRNPSWASTRRFMSEILTPSTVQGYYQPLSMISLMLDYAMGGRPDYLRPFHRTSLILHVMNTLLVIGLLYRDL